MSYTRMFIIDNDGLVTEEKEYRNSHGTMVLWRALGHKYNEEVPLFRDNPAFWKLQNDSRLTPAERTAFRSTLDGAVAKRADLLDLAAAFDEVTATIPHEGLVWHLDSMARDIRAAYEVGAAAVGWHQTSTNGDCIFSGKYADDDVTHLPFKMAEAIEAGDAWVITVDHKRAQK